MTWKNAITENPKKSPAWIIFEYPSRFTMFSRNYGVGWFFPGVTNFWYVPNAPEDFVVIAWQEIEPYEVDDVSQSA